MLLEALDTFIGLITVFLILSLIVSALGEGLSNLLNFKGRVFKKSIATLLKDDETTGQFFAHEAVDRLCKPPWLRKTPRLPSYVPDTVIAEVILDLCVNPPPTVKNLPITASTVDRALHRLDDKLPYAKALKDLWRRADCDVDTFKASIADWFNRTGDRSTGWFRRRLALLLFGIGFVAAIGLNADTLYMFRKLSEDESLRASLVVVATDLVEEARTQGTGCDDAACEALVTRFIGNPQIANVPPPANAEPLSDDERTELMRLCSQDPLEPAACAQTLGQRRDVQGSVCVALDEARDCTLVDLLGAALPETVPLLGFDLFQEERANSKSWWPFWPLKLLGWILTAAAVSLGAPFWFDLLQKIVQIRSSVKPSASAPAPASPAATGGEPATAEAPRARSVIRSVTAAADALEDIARFDATTFGFSPVNLFWSARFAKLAYVTDTGALAAELEVWGAQGELLDRSDTQCIVALTPKAAFVSFRGTETNLNDWMTDLDAELVAPEWETNAGYQVHKGFRDALEDVWADHDDFEGLITRLEANDVFSRKLPIWLSGHSLGGALAALGALRLAYVIGSKGHENTIGGVHTFGQPRVGNRACAAAIDSAVPARYFRSVNNRDIVPRVPLPGTPDLKAKIKDAKSPLVVHEYVHAGRVIYFNDAGKAMMDPPLWYRGLDASAVGLTKEAIVGALKQAVGDHDMSGYVMLHRALLDVTAADAAA